LPNRGVVRLDGGIKLCAQVCDERQLRREGSMGIALHDKALSLPTADLLSLLLL
jgi:hypothetical protein